MPNSYLSSNTGTATNAKKFTLSMWIKRGNLCDSNSQRFYQGYKDGNNRFYVMFDSTSSNPDTLWIYAVTGGTVQVYWTSSRKFRDTSGWYHFVFQADSTLGTAADRLKVYVNGVLETSFTKNNNPGSNIDWGNQLAQTNGDLTISGTESQTQHFDGYMSHVAFVDGQALAPTEFGETDSTSGIWKFKSPTGITWGDNGYHLKFENSGNLGLDSSGEGNNFTTNGNLKQALDTPSNVYCTLNPLEKYAAALTNGNTTVTNESNNATIVLSTLAVNSGKWYWEAKINDTASDTFNVGIRKTGFNNYNISEVAYGSNAWVYAVDGNIYHNGSALLDTGTTATVGDIIGFILDLDAGTLKLKKNGADIYSGNAVVSSLNTGDYYHVHQGASQAQVDFNFGNGFFGTTAITSAGLNGNTSLFEYDVPANHYAINTKNINTYG